MTLGDLLKQYVAEQIGPIETIRRLSGVFQPEHAVDLLCLICAITRVEQGDLDRETFKKVWMKLEGESDVKEETGPTKEG